MSKKPQEEIEVMLDNIEIIDGIPSFPSIENLSVDVLSEIANNLSNFVGDEMLSYHKNIYDYAIRKKGSSDISSGKPPIQRKVG